MSAPTFVVYARSFNRSACKACRSPIDFYQLADSNRWMPFDPGTAIVRSFPRAIDGLLCHEITGVSHFSTCPQAEKFRKTEAPAAANQAKQESLF